MKIPNSIKKSIIKCANHNNIAVKEQKNIENWLIKKGIDVENDSLRDVLIDCVEISYNPQSFIDYLENEI